MSNKIKLPHLPQPAQMKMWAAIGTAAAMIQKGQAVRMELADGVTVYLEDKKVKIEIPLETLDKGTMPKQETVD